MNVDLVVTHAQKSLVDVAERMTATGLNVAHVPLIDIQISNNEPQWLPAEACLAICSSSYAADYVVAHQKYFNRSRFAVLSKRIASKLEAAGLTDVQISSRQNGLTLATEASTGSAKDLPVFVLQGSSSDSEIADICRERLSNVTEVVVYINEPLPVSTQDRSLLVSSKAVFFASPSAIGYFRPMLSNYNGNIGVIGDTTANHLRNSGREPDFVANMSSGVDLVDQLSHWLQ